MTSDIRKAQSSFHAGRVRAARRARGNGGLLDPGPGLGLSASARGSTEEMSGETRVEVGRVPWKDQCQVPAAGSEPWFPSL